MKKITNKDVTTQRIYINGQGKDIKPKESILVEGKIPGLDPAIFEIEEVEKRIEEPKKEKKKKGGK